MPEKRLYDTRFFVEYFYSDNPEVLRELKQELSSVKERMASSLTVHEIHRINLKREGKDVATLRSNAISEDFRIIDVNYKLAVKSAELRNTHQIPMAASVIAVTAQVNQSPIFTDDPHFKKIENSKTVWL